MLDAVARRNRGRSVILFALSLLACRSAVVPDPGPGNPPNPSDSLVPPDEPAEIPPEPWFAPVEICGGGDEDGDGRVDEDCAPSLWSGVFVPEASADFAGDGLVARMAADAGRPVPVLQTYRSTSVLGAENAANDLAIFWANGAVVHLNVEPLGYSAAQYASGGADPAMEADFALFAAAVGEVLVADPTGRVLVTFGAEMNGSWTDWGCLAAADYIALHRAFRAQVDGALASRAIEPRRVRWVFGPDSRGTGTCATAADYFPGGVDFLGLSAYRNGVESLQTTVITPAIALMDALGWPAGWRTDRVVVLQTASRVDDRDVFSEALFGELQSETAFLGVIWFDATDDWAVLDATGPLPGYDAWTVARSALPLEDAQLEGTFEPFFWDVSRARADYPEIQALAAAGVTSGCSADPPLFCPADPLARADASVLLERAFGATDPTLLARPGDDITRYELAAALVALTGVERRDSPFTDLAGDAAGGIAGLAWRGDVSGCTPSTFCPDLLADRATAGVWITRCADLSAAPVP